MTEQYDVIVVGGSVSGAPTAAWLARKGFRVLVVEKATFPRDANSTHFIWPRGMSYLNRLGVADRILEETPHFKQMEINIEGIRLHGGVPIQAIRDRFVALHGDDHGVVDYYAGPRRFFLDQVLLEEAQASGAEVRQATRVESLIEEDGAVVGIRAVPADGAAFEARARVVIGADGRMSQFATQVNAQKTAVREKSTFAYYGYFSGIDKPELCIHKRGRFGTAIFPTMEDRHLVLVYGPTEWWGDFSKDPETSFFKTYEFVAPDVAELVKQGERVEPFKAMGRMVAFHRENWGNGWALVGDACSFKDQWTAMGITHALRDAELLSTHLAMYLNGDKDWDTTMSDYSAVRFSDYEDYWNLVCDGAEMHPYTREELEFFHGIEGDQDKVDQFIGQVGDTISLKHQIQPESRDQQELPDFIREFDSEALAYHQNAFVE
ncbi:FAD-dependent oxidoreductase [Marinobacter zhejiangensis]|uniref:Dehydrogenase (Flavoprotein) n=1 Tax=Marinobacter zhejiangensis TaxID=488535 RepID=A0A1I4TN60_9GAMM|nr:NAD(P)/FAD-dependent oxidoreductase [Marinobacter zhejiangensis]SFM78000.1 Dehydrogenase (flavoprotein) [Marinobacter zhejiangensis]